jgi:hypothetical protein
MSFMNLPIANLLIDAGGLIILVLVILGVIYKIDKGMFHHFLKWRVFDDASTSGKGTSSSAVTTSFFTILVREVFAFRVLETCSKVKRFAHLAIFWGFVCLGVSTTLAYLTNPTNAILPLYNPVKVFGNAGGILVIAGFIPMFVVRYRERTPIWKITRTDFFLVTLFLAALTGFIIQQAIYSSLGSLWVSSSFWIHMVFVVVLLVTAPYTKFFHAVSKPISLLYDEIDQRTGRTEPLLPLPMGASTTSSVAAPIQSDNPIDSAK